MATQKKKSVTNAKVTKLQPKPKMPTKEEMFEKAIMPTFKSMLKSDKDRLCTAQGIESIRNIVDRLYDDAEAKPLANHIRRALYIIDKYINPHIKDLEVIIANWDYKTFIELKESPFKHLSSVILYKDYHDEKNDLQNEENYIARFIYETIDSAYISKIQEGQRQLENCE